MDTEHLYLLVGAMTNSGHVYTMIIILEDFPYQVPPICVMNPLKSKTGKKLCKRDGGMLVLGEHDGHTQKCHYVFFLWKADVSIYRLFIKCRLWLEMYEVHLHTGRSIDYYLKHQY